MIAKERLNELMIEYADFHIDVKDFCGELNESFAKMDATKNTMECMQSLNTFQKKCIERLKKQLEKNEMVQKWIKQNQ